MHFNRVNCSVVRTYIVLKKEISSDTTEYFIHGVHTIQHFYHYDIISKLWLKKTKEEDAFNITSTRQVYDRNIFYRYCLRYFTNINIVFIFLIGNIKFDNIHLRDMIICYF